MLLVRNSTSVHASCVRSFLISSSYLILMNVTVELLRQEVYMFEIVSDKYLFSNLT